MRPTGGRRRWSALLLALGATEKGLPVSVGAVLWMLEVERLQGTRPFGKLLGARPWPVRWAVYAALVLAIQSLGAPKAEPFIYFQR